MTARHLELLVEEPSMEAWYFGDWEAAVAETLRAADQIVDGPGRYEAGLKPGSEPGDRRIGSGTRRARARA